MDPKAFWKFKMQYGRQVYSTYAYPDKLLAGAIRLRPALA
jgi:hypothetical protein